MKPTTRDGILRGGYAVLARLPILAAAVVSGYLLSVSLSGGSAVGCGPGSACDQVLQSRWAYVLGLPVSALALVVDLTLLLATFACGPASSPKQRRGAWEIIVPCAVLVLGAALWFAGLQAFVLHRFCPWCMAAHSCGAVAAIVLLMRVPIADARERQEKQPAMHSTLAIKLALAAIAATALFAAVQVIAPRKAYSVATVSNPKPVEVGAPNLQANKSPANVTLPTTNVTTRSVAAGLSNASLAGRANDSWTKFVKDNQFLPILGGRFTLNLKEVPLWGSPDAPTKLVSLYDYTCHHCREMHPHVAGLRRTFGDKLAIISLPMPLDSQCNPLMRQTPRPHLNACTYARLGLIVWRAKHQAIEPFDDWLFSFPNPPPLAAVTNKAIDLIGMMAFDIASRDPRIEQQLRTDIDIYTVNGREFKQDKMPQFIVGSNIISGILTPEQLRGFVAPHIPGL